MAEYTVGTMRRWDVQSGVQIGEPLLGHEFPLNFVEESRDGNVIMSKDGTVLQWDAQSGAPICHPLHADECIRYLTETGMCPCFVMRQYDC